MHKVIERVLQMAQGNIYQFSINITEENLRDPDFITNFRKLLVKYDVPATRICIEITEDVVSINTEYIQKLEELDRMGCEFAIDDFLTKSSGWGRTEELKKRLKNLHYLKIDGSFIRDIDINGEHYAIVK